MNNNKKFIPLIKQSEQINSLITNDDVRMGLINARHCGLKPLKLTPL